MEDDAVLETWTSPGLTDPSDQPLRVTESTARPRESAGQPRGTGRRWGRAVTPPGDRHPSWWWCRLAQSCQTLCDPTDYSVPGLVVEDT